MASEKNQDATEPTLYCLELDDGVQFHVAARTAANAIRLATEFEPMLFAESRTLAVTPRASRDVAFLDDSDGGTKTIRAAMAGARAMCKARGTREPERVIACSEWP